MTFLSPRAWIASASCLLVAAAGMRISAQGAKAAVPTAAQVEFFEANIRPVLIDTCGECHGDDQEGKLRTDSRAALLKGGETGPAIEPGDPDKSLLIHAIRRDPDFPRMPKGKPRLSAATIAALVEWVKQGAPWPEEKPG